MVNFRTAVGPPTRASAAEGRSGLPRAESRGAAGAATSFVLTSPARAQVIMLSSKPRTPWNLPMPETLEPKVRETLRNYVREVKALPNEAAKRSRFSALIAELFRGTSAVSEFSRVSKSSFGSVGLAESNAGTLMFTMGTQSLSLRNRFPPRLRRRSCNFGSTLQVLGRKPRPPRSSTASCPPSSLTPFAAKGLGTAIHMLKEDILSSIEHGSESGSVEYKASFDPSSGADWLEIIKDIVALANSGGGVIVFGIADNGKVSGFDPSALTGIDPAVLTDKISKYTGQQFAEIGRASCRERVYVLV